MVPRRRKHVGRKEIFGFTLVELVIVITILAILATIGFLALSSYAQDARDSAIKANVRSIQAAILSESSVTGESPRKFVIHDADYALSGAFAYVDGTWIALTGGNAWENPLDSNYSAGKPNFAKLKINPDKFKITKTSNSPFFGGIFGSEITQAYYDPFSAMAGAADFTVRGSSGKFRAVSYVQTAGISPSSKIGWVAGNFPTTDTPNGYVSWLIRSEPGVSSNLTGALMDGKTANAVSIPDTQSEIATQILSLSPAVSGKTTWNLGTDGPLVLSSTGNYSIVPVWGTATVRIKAWWAAGSNMVQGSTTFVCNGNVWGAGGFAGGTLAMNGTKTYLAVVGEAWRFEGEGNAHGGWGLAQSSSNGSYVVSWGGWLSGIFEGSFAQQNALLIAGAGGWAAGSEGGAAGERAPDQNTVSWWGYPGTLTAGGTRGTPATATYNSASNFLSWSALQGGQTLWTAQSWGGGGGWYFWGGPWAKNNYVWSGGGGGSNFAAASVSTPVLTNGVGTVPGNAADADRGTAWSAVVWVSTAVSPISTAFASCRGNNGKMVISLP